MSPKFTNASALVWSLTVLAGSCLLFAVGAYLNTTNRQWDGVVTRESSGVVWLFALPLFMQVGGCFYLRLKTLESEGSGKFFGFYLTTMLFCAVFNYGLWIVYLVKVHPANQQNPDGVSVQWLSVTSLLCILILLAFVVVVTFAFMTPQDDGHSGRLM